MSLSILSFSQCLVSAGDVVADVQTKNAAEVKSEAPPAGELNNFKPQLDKIDNILSLPQLAENGGISDEQRKQMWGSASYLLNVHPTEGTDADKLFYLAILSNRICAEFVKNNKFVSEFFGGVLPLDKLSILVSRYVKDVLCMSDRFRCTGKAIYDYSKELGDKARGIYLNRGVADAVNAMFKDENIRKELAKPVYEKEFSELMNLNMAKLTADINTEERYIEKVKNEKPTPEEARKSALCDAKRNVAYFEGVLKEERFATIEGYRKFIEKQKEDLEKEKDEPWNTTEEGKKGYDERMAQFNKLLTDENELKASYNNQIEEQKKYLEENRAVLNDNAKLEERINERCTRGKGSENFLEELLQNGKDFLNALKVVTLESVNRAGDSMNLGGFTGNFFELQDNGIQVPYNSCFEHDIDYASKINDLKSKAVFAKVRFKFNGLSRALQNVVYDMVERGIMESGCFGDGVFSGRRDRTVELDLKDGVVYCVPDWVYENYSKTEKEFLSGVEDCFGFTVMAKDLETLERFKTSFQDVVKGVLAKGFNDADLSERIGWYVEWKSRDYFQDVVRYVSEKREDVAKRCFTPNYRGQIEVYSSNLGAFARLFSDYLNTIFDIDVNSEDFRKAYAANFEKIRNNAIDSYLNGGQKFGIDKDVSLNLNDKKALLSMAVSNVDGLDVGVLDSVPKDENAFENFEKSILKDGSCCYEHANFKVKPDDSIAIKNIFSADSKNVDVSVNIIDDIGDSLTVSEFSCFWRSCFCKNDLFKDIAFIWSLNRSKDEFERIKQEFSVWQQFFSTLSVKENVKKLTPEQRQKVLSACLLICKGVDCVGDVVNYAFKDVPNIEIDFISYGGAVLAKYFEILAKAVDEKLVSFN